MMSKWLLLIFLIAVTRSAGAQTLAPPPMPANQSAALTGGKIGAAIGGALGVGFGIAVAQAGCDGSRCGSSNVFVDSVFFGVTGAAIGGLIGTAIDRAHKHPSRRAGIDIAPILSRDARGGRLALRF
jgi:hypothetical protein